MFIQNPILPGFNPDPSILRVGDDYYIATSTFEWFPGVQIHHSRDLVHWRLIGHPLTRTSQLEMKGNPNSGGIWAPCLSYSDGLFYLVYTDVKSWSNTFKDTHNYLVTAPDINGPWSEPVYLNSIGFDPSLFHDEDGRKWFVGMLNDFRKGKNVFAGIILQEYCPRTQKLVGPAKNIFKGTSLGCTEGPHLYKHNGYYYLVTAEGGTWWTHSVTVARSKEIEGPYEVDPTNPILTSSDDSELVLQKAGHASFVQTQSGEWYLAHLCSRPLKEQQKSILGRETSLQKMVYTEDGWFRLADGGHSPRTIVEAPNLPPCPWPCLPETDHFDGEELNLHWATLRVPADESWVSLRSRPGYLRIHGRESLISLHEQSMVARRQQAFVCEAATCIEFEPESFQQMAGLIAFYDTGDHAYLKVSRDDEGVKTLSIVVMDKGNYSEPLEHEISVEGWKQIHLKVSIRHDRLQFYYSAHGTEWEAIGPELDASHLSDENGKMGFTGNFIGLCVQDVSGSRLHADFDYFTYRELNTTV